MTVVPAAVLPAAVLPTAADTDGAKAAAAAARADARARRIASAVARSKTEYRPEHAYTERGWHLSADVAGPSKADRQRVEFASTARLAAPPADAGQNERALADIRACAGSRPLTSLPRELVATGMRAAIAARDTRAAAEFAHASRVGWRQSAGAAVLASEALELAGELQKATHPLLAATAMGIHHPVLLRLHAVLSLLPPTEPTTSLLSVLGPLAESRAWAFSQPLFPPSTTKVRAGGPPHGGDALRATLAAVDRGALAAALGLSSGPDRGVLDAALARVARALGGGEEEPEVAEGERVERGVREL